MDGNNAPRFDCDVLVVGGGPGGSTISTLLARRGWRVTMLEKSRHPRFHIGESLLPANIPIFEELGALEKLRELGRLKLGADFPRDDGSYYTFRFDRALGDTPPYAFQVKRADMDRMLFEHARASGVEAHEHTTVERAEFDAVGVTAHIEAGTAKSTLRARYLVDASGRDTLLGRQLKLVERSDRHQSAAMFAHYKGVAYNPDDPGGNIISVNRFAHGWAWFIPLPGGITSVGCVCKPGYLRTRQGASHDAFMASTLAIVPGAERRMTGAERVTPVRFTGNYSYACRRMAGPRWILVGDAWAFLDPVFSSGVFLSMYSARRALDVVDGALREPRREAALQRRYAQHLRRGYARFAWFICRFNSPVMKALFADPRNVLQVEQGVISMLAGDVFDNRRVLSKLRVFKTLYALTSLANLRGWAAERFDRRRQNRMRVAADALAE
ncbi:MAG: putative FAD-binding protein [Rhodanobacteraceae bacterium]|jgi:flavin-dependent dehydrogenase|nr:MAG: putative FAD-binding protein [Rhodanobacteraceae bacterium]